MFIRTHDEKCWNLNQLQCIWVEATGDGAANLMALLHNGGEYILSRYASVEVAYDVLSQILVADGFQEIYWLPGLYGDEEDGGENEDDT